MSTPRTFTDRAARRPPLVASCLGVVLVGGLAVVLVPSLAGVVTDPSLGPGTLALLAQLVCNPCVLFAGGLLGFLIYKGWQVPRVVVLEPTHLRVPANGTRAVYAVGVTDGYRYSPRKGVLTVRVPYGRITEVRRATAAEQQEVGRRGRHYTVSVNRRVRRVRGHALDEEGAAAVFDEELRGCWVSAPERAVAIGLSRLCRQDEMWPTFPADPRDVVLFVSVDDPDALVEALTAKIMATATDPSEPSSPSS